MYCQSSQLRQNVRNRPDKTSVHKRPLLQDLKVVGANENDTMSAVQAAMRQTVIGDPVEENDQLLGVQQCLARSLCDHCCLFNPLHAVLRRHLWYFSEHLMLLVLFDIKVIRRSHAWLKFHLLQTHPLRVLISRFTIFLNWLQCASYHNYVLSILGASLVLGIKLLLIDLHVVERYVR